jgi:SPASM domain peptide maturase of grasp-with-spasm system
MFDENGVADCSNIEVNPESKSIVDSYIDLLQKNELIHLHFDDDIDILPKLSLEWDFPATISNIIIDIPEVTLYDYNKLFSVYFDEVNCRYVQLRYYHKTNIQELNNIISIINMTPIRTVDIVLTDSPENFSHDSIIDWVTDNRKIRTLTLHSSSENKLIKNEEFGFGLIMAVEEQILSEKNCGIVHPTYFTSSIEFYTESQHYNTCLNRKASIDRYGNIKNCPSMVDNFGNINNTSLLEAINKPGFMKYWNVSKDKITQCRDCEFRHICTDCRAYVENPEDIFSKPLKCGYNPYDNSWQEWSTNPLKQSAIQHYNL